MKLTATIREIIKSIISYLFILIFVYAALTKLIEFQNFQAQLGQSPLLSAYTGFISYSVLIVELVIAFLLSIPRTRSIGLLSSFALMIMFTVYIIVILNYSSFVPCSCGGILEKMSWKEHLIFNSAFTLLAAIASLLIATDRTHTLIKLSIIAITASAIIGTLYLYSEDTMHRVNPFIRRFIQGAASKTAEAELNNNSKYFAGTDGSNIYFGDSEAPLYIIAYDTTLKTKRQYKIQLERENFPFTSVQVRIAPPYFYLMDGTVPVIYKGIKSDWKAKLLMYDNNYYFSQAEIIASDKIAFRAQQQKTLYNILGTFTFKHNLQVQYAPQLLQKQIDGFFDTDGMMRFDSRSQKLIYTYYYRNQYIVADNNGNLIHRGNTIDTTTKAKLKVAHIKETGQRKIASLPTTVNQLTAVSNNLLFVNSMLIGRYEPKEMWKQAAIIDVYNIEKNTYLSSIYIYDINKTKLKEMFVVNNNLYAIIGHRVHKYQLSKKHFKN
ncbi:putative membrane protein YphA (DoxX/SURF4 family) [Flavobacterium sp. CG_9.1]|uniref:MauE/DoxX family redox-associated membrane protein n=1 Tax=Flavobacterium sp. CG_9.1 TaxID=2787728 RepID=UPI0018CB560E|nr:MauE/DoxX family redox-associated membrane protein [Flavobacterium sp. CG_9.1]MBG6062905.1 putative membrane protein YphA (DoxX/SURF4 family) [Flavobacterium sp. CG_9.1]